MEFALKWVQKNIGKFGGDAKRVTLAGQSAGAGGVMLLTIARNGHLGTTLFHNVCSARIIASGVSNALTGHYIFSLPPTAVRLQRSNSYPTLSSFCLSRGMCHIGV